VWLDSGELEQLTKERRGGWLSRLLGSNAKIKTMDHRVIRAPRGAQLNCKGWHQEAAFAA
jgi:Zn-finger nucleic acid-binding protein